LFYLPSYLQADGLLIDLAVLLGVGAWEGAVRDREYQWRYGSPSSVLLELLDQYFRRGSQTMECKRKEVVCNKHPKTNQGSDKR
jgi:hypothetical protein